MKYIYIPFSIALFLGGVWYGRISAPQTFGAASDEKAAVIVKYVEAQARLKSSAELDSNLTMGEVTSALNKLKDDYSITQGDLNAHGGNINAALQSKLGAQSKLCNNPNSEAHGPKTKNLTNP